MATEEIKTDQETSGFISDKQAQQMSPDISGFISDEQAQNMPSEESDFIPDDVANDMPQENKPIFIADGSGDFDLPFAETIDPNFRRENPPVREYLMQGTHEDPSVLDTVKNIFATKNEDLARFKTGFEIAEDFNIPLEEAYDNRAYRGMAAETMGAPKPYDQVQNEALTVGFTTAVVAGLFVAPIPTLKGIFTFMTAKEVVNAAIDGRDYEFMSDKTWGDRFVESNPDAHPGTIASLDLAELFALGGATAMVSKGTGPAVDVMKWKVNKIIAKGRAKSDFLAEGIARDSKKISLSTKLQPDKVEMAIDRPVLLRGEPVEPIEFTQRQFTPEEIVALERTSIKGAKSLAEVRNKMARKFKMAKEQIADFTGLTWLDELKPDGVLIESHPLLKDAITKYQTANIKASQNTLKFKQKVDVLASAARKSRPRTLVDKAVPTDKLVVEYLESADKASIKKKMTPEEVTYAEYLQTVYTAIFDSLAEMGKITSRLDNYYTHQRRGFLEALKAEGKFGKAWNEMWNNFTSDQLRNDFFDKTGKRRTFESTFKNARKRWGTAIPSENTAKVITDYHATYERVKALDSVVPELMVAVESLKPKNPTRLELEAHKFAVELVNDWVLTKKGVSKRYLIDPKSKTAIALKGMRTVVSMLDLGFNPITGTAAFVGEQSFNRMALSRDQAMSGFQRMTTKQGQRIIKNNEAWIGESVWKEMTDATNNIADTTMKAMFAFFRKSSVEANKHFLLSSLTEKELASGKVSNERLAEIALKMNRYRHRPGFESIAEQTVEGEMFGQYKKWALPPMVSTVQNLGNVLKNIKDPKKIDARTKAEIGRAAEVVAATTILALAMYPEKEDQSVDAKWRRKIVRESVSILGMIKLFASGEMRTASFVAQFGSGLFDMAFGFANDDMDKFDSGLDSLQRSVTPSVIETSVDVMREKGMIPEKVKRKRTKPSEKPETGLIEDVMENL